MSKLNVTFEELPVWLTHEEAGRLVASRTLKELRENRKIRFQTLDGKLCYLLLDLLTYKGIGNLIFYGEAPIEGATSEVAEEETPVAPVQTPQIEESETERKFFYTDLFTFESNSIPPETPLPTFRIRKGHNNFSYAQSVEGKLVDVQFYAATMGQDTFPKVRFIVQSLKNPNHYLVMQTRYDKYHCGWFADILAEAIARQEDLTQVLTIAIGMANNGQNVYSAKFADSALFEFVNPSEFNDSVDIKVLEAKLKASQEGLTEQGLKRTVLTETSDKNYTKSKNKPKKEEEDDDAEF